MKTWPEVMSKAMAGFRKAVAHAIHCSLSRVDQMTYPLPEEGGEGVPCHAMQVERTVKALRDQHAPEAELPFLFLAERLEYFPPIRRVDSTHIDFAAFGDFVKETGELFLAFNTSFTDSTFDDDELARADRELVDVERTVANLRAAFEREKQKRAARLGVRAVQQ